MEKLQISNQDIVTPDKLIRNAQGAYLVPDNTDPLSLKYDGSYACVHWLDGVLPYDQTLCNITVKMGYHNNYRTLIASFPSRKTVWRNCMQDGAWEGWRLIAGEAMIWSGGLSSGDVPLSMPLSYFNSIFVANDNGFKMTGANLNASGFINATGSHTNTTSSTLIATYFNKVNDSKLALLGCTITILANGKSAEVKTQKITSIYGRP